MQQVENWPDDDIYEFTWRIIIDGREVTEPSSVILGRSMTGGLPKQVSTGYGISPSTGEIIWGSDDSLTDLVGSPWSGRLPKKGDRIEIDVGYNGMFVRVFTGRVLYVTGDTSDRVVLKVVDDFDNFRRRVLIDPIMATGPRLDIDNKGSNLVSPGLSPTYFLSVAAATSGFYSVPARVSNAVMYANLNGSATPERGTLVASDKNGWSSLDRRPTFSPSPWGQAPHDLVASYAPRIVSSTEGKLIPGRPLKMSFIRGKPGAVVTRISANWGGYAIRLTVSPAGRVFLRYWDGTSETLSNATTLRENEVVVAELRDDGSYRVRTSGGEDVQGTLPVHQSMRDDFLDRVVVRVPVDGTQVGGVQVWFGSTWAPLDFTRTAHLEHSGIGGTLEGTRSIDTEAQELISEISEAELGASWINAHGHMVFRNRDALVEAEPVRTLTSKNDLYSYSWVYSTDSVKRRTYVEWTSVAPSYSVYPTITVWQGPGGAIEPDERREVIIKPGNDEEWVGLDDSFMSALDPSSGFPSTFRRGHGSWSFGTYEFTGADIEWETYRAVSSTLNKIGPRAWKIIQAADIEVDQSVPSNPQNLDPLPDRMHGEKLPILRSRGLLVFERETIGATLSGPDWAEEYVHDAGQWVQSEQNAEILADAIQKWVSEPMPLIDGVSIHPDPRLELGDMVRIRDSHALNREILGLITGIRLSGNSEVEMTLDCQIISSVGIDLEV